MAGALLKDGDRPADDNAEGKATNNTPPIVGIGSSAGGVAALQNLVSNIPADSGIAWVLIQHMAPDRPSELASILARKADLPVEEVTHDTRIEADRIYLIAPGQVMTIREGVLRPAQDGDPLARRTSIDAFLVSLAEDQGEHSGCALLSGAGTDGTLGLKAVKEAGGLTLTQTLQTAEYDSMLLSATRTGLVDREADVADMPGLFADFLVRRKPITRDVEVEDGERREICDVLRRATGHDFTDYKSSTIDRRIRRRMQMQGIDTLSAYVDLMRNDRREPERLFRDLLIGVTQFFRDTDLFAALAAKVLGPIMEKKTEDDEVRVWVAGCATGEEAYSLAILFQEARARMESPPEVKIFGSDIDEAALHFARIGRYPHSIAADVNEERLERFFEKEDGHYTIRPLLREMCLFAQHNLLRDPPFSRIDLLSCRNVLIYMNPGLQERLMPVFHYALRPGGFLFLGPAENAGHDKLFGEFDRKHRIFRRMGETARLPEFPIAGGDGKNRQEMQRQDAATKPAVTDPAFRTAQKLLERYTPAYVIVDGDFEILDASTGTGGFLELPRGRPKANLAAMARTELAVDIKAAVAKVLTSGERFVRDDLIVGHDDERRYLTLIVEPLTGADASERRCLVVFQAGAAAMAQTTERARQRGGDEELVRALELELQTTKERLQSTLEELETSNEELRASNEELSSVNEELQSSNEELETSKEELQSINEELRTVNNELSTRVEEQSRANSDLKNLFSNTRIAMLFLDAEFRIRNFTPPAKPLFRLRDHDMGRPLDELAGRVELGSLKEQVAEVIRSGEQIEKEVEAQNGEPQTLIMRMLPYRDENDVIQGAVLTFIDITARKRSEERLSDMVSELNHRVKNNLASVQSMIRQAAQHTETKDEIYKVLTGQLHAMAASHDILSRGDWKGARLHDLVGAVLSPFVGEGLDGLSLQGPEVHLKPQVVVGLGVILHELATNASKYGAWSTGAGRVSLNWTRVTTDGDELRIEWAESGGPPVAPPKSNGFGLNFVSRSTQHELRGTCQHEFPSAGYRCVIVAPAKAMLMDRDKNR
ncbi:MULTISPECIES: CheR family methyltransferase [unclassified Mesorhizobium]|uniref:CheR family methyltransferase n=1 Tax=unclassified Mesorhizobium TaxID=325217 RepID=UPI001CCFF66C|nr:MULTISPECIES: CheR family methyltransferase [unclassified Mesorhizobium]MBZ9815210.1 PAS domain-containing protein [Mesorhizobium sp. CA7]MBZ9845143.1 PAS domain-containing protein [Mesorhizobium sp. CA5]MBZ9862050.1 PAS domain-containing protein [Mesorhizobium sp. CA12]